MNLSKNKRVDIYLQNTARRGNIKIKCNVNKNVNKNKISCNVEVQAVNHKNKNCHARWQ